MLNTVIDIEVLEQFMLARPDSLLLEDVEAHDRWSSLFKFLKGGTNLQLSVEELDINSPIISLINVLTTGRNGTKFNQSKFKKPHKDKLLKGVDVQTLFFLNTSREQAKKLNKKNGLAFSSIDSYFDDWNNLNFDCKPSVYPVTKENGLFQSWNKIGDYVFAITDIVIIDAYIFSDSSLLESNLYKIIESLGNNVPNKINLTIVSYSDDRNPIDITAKYNELKVFFEQNGLAINLSIVLTKQSNKQHDRAILTNYFMISSGDSFNYFNSKGDVITKGTDIRFDTYCNPLSMNIADVKLKSVQTTISSIVANNDKGKCIKGDIEGNRLLKAIKQG